eukprot:Clim_evm23s167 gene=Clim_evmTU23s167
MPGAPKEFWLSKDDPFPKPLKQLAEGASVRDQETMTLLADMSAPKRALVQSSFYLSRLADPEKAKEDLKEIMTSFNSALEAQKDMPSLLDGLAPFETKDDKVKVFDDLMKWAKERGVVGVDNFEIDVDYAEGPGLKCKTEIKKGDMCLIMPLKTMLHEKSVHANNALLGVKKKLELKGTDYLQLLLLKEVAKKGDSAWSAYINALPRTYDTPLYASFEDMQAFEHDPHILAETAKLNKFVMRSYLNIMTSLEGKTASLGIPQISLADWRWAYQTIISRQNNLTYNPEKKDYILALIPVWDMANYDYRGTITTVFDPAKEVMECSAKKTFQAGDQFYIFYGMRPNHLLFLYQGFVPEKNNADIFPLSLSLKPNAEHQQDKRVALQRAQFQSPGVTLNVKRDGEVPLEVMPMARCLCANGEDIKKSKEKVGFLDISKPQDFEFESRAIGFLRTRVNILKMHRERALKKLQEGGAANGKYVQEAIRILEGHIEALGNCAIKLDREKQVIDRVIAGEDVQTVYNEYEAENKKLQEEEQKRLIAEEEV